MKKKKEIVLVNGLVRRRERVRRIALVASSSLEWNELDYVNLGEDWINLGNKLQEAHCTSLDWIRCYWVIVWRYM